MTLRLHWSPDSANLVVRAALEVFGQPYEAVRVDRSAKDHKSAGYLAKNPQGLIPVLEDGDIVLFETGAILWHLIEKTGRLGPDGPDASDPKARAAALKWLFYLSNTVHADMRCAFYTHRWIAKDRIEELRDGLRQRIAGHFGLLDAQLTDGGLIGPLITLPDIYAVLSVRWMRIFPWKAPMFGNLDEYPHLLALSARIEALPGIRAAFEAERIDPHLALTQPAMSAYPVREITG